MVIVTTHAIASFLFYQRDPERFLASANTATSSDLGNETDAGIKRIKQERAVNETFNVSWIEEEACTFLNFLKLPSFNTYNLEKNWHP